MAGKRSTGAAKIQVGDNVLAIFAIAGLVLLEVAALDAGLNGQVFATIVAAIAGLGGYSLRPIVGQLRRRRQETDRDGPRSEPPD